MLRMDRRATRWAKTLTLATAIAASLSAAGCNMLLPFVFIGHHKEKVEAEFTKLENRRVAVVVWAPQETLFDYPHVRLELSTHIADRLWARVKNVEVVDCRKIEDYIERSLAFAIDPEIIGDKFDAEMVVYVELLEFQIRDPAAPDLLRASIRASVNVYDLTVDPDQPKRYELEEVAVKYPESGTVQMTATSSLVVRKAAYEAFADAVARKFFDYEREI